MTTTLARALCMLSPFAVAIIALGGCARGAPVDDEETEVATAAVSEDECPANTPAAVNPAPDQNLWKIYDATGVQIYSCAVTTGGGFAWTFYAPRADLFDDEGAHRANHFAGPTWEANDGSTVIAAKTAGATVDPTAIPWLLLTTSSHNATDGHFSDVSSIQRLETVGGLAPATGCDAAHAGAITEVAYTARYAMYKTKAHGHVHQCASQ